MEKDTVKYKKKANNLNTILKNEYSDSKKILEENCNVEKILKTEIADLLQVWFVFKQSFNGYHYIETNLYRRKVQWFKYAGTD